MTPKVDSTSSSPRSRNSSPSRFAIESRGAEFQKIVANLLPRPAQETLLLFSLMAPLKLPARVRLSVKSTKLLRETGRRRSYTVGVWPEHGLNSGRYPTLCCVLDGAADWRAGVTRQMAASVRSGEPKPPGAYVLQIPARTFFLIPPGVPFDDGSRAHCDEAFGEVKSRQTHTRIFWIEVQPQGAILHTCHSDCTTHRISPALYVFDSQLSHLIEEIEAELANYDALHASELAMHYLSCLLLRLHRALATGQTSLAEGVLQSSGPGIQGEAFVEHPADKSTSLQRACHYVEAHLGESLSVEILAAHAFVSPAQLNRLFRSHLQTSPMQFVGRRRMEAAESLLQNTELPIDTICGYIGYHHVAHFSRLFKQWSGLSPTAYRKQHKDVIPPDRG